MNFKKMNSKKLEKYIVKNKQYLYAFLLFDNLNEIKKIAFKSQAVLFRNGRIAFLYMDNLFVLETNNLIPQEDYDLKGKHKYDSDFDIVGIAISETSQIKDLKTRIFDFFSKTETKVSIEEVRSIKWDYLTIDGKVVDYINKNQSFLNEKVIMMQSFLQGLINTKTNLKYLILEKKAIKKRVLYDLFLKSHFSLTHKNESPLYFFDDQTLFQLKNGIICYKDKEQLKKVQTDLIVADIGQYDKDFNTTRQGYDIMKIKFPSNKTIDMTSLDWDFVKKEDVYLKTVDDLLKTETDKGVQDFLSGLKKIF